MARQTLQQRVAAAELKANRLRTQLSQVNRKADTRRKIVVGGMVLAAMEQDAALRRQVVDLLRAKVRRPLDREAVAELLGEQPGTVVQSAAA